jgi:hypothetical protein
MTMTETQARAAGYTQEIEWIAGCGFGGAALIRPDADTGGEFRAYCLEEGEMIQIAGWNAEIWN